MQVKEDFDLLLELQCGIVKMLRMIVLMHFAAIATINLVIQTSTNGHDQDNAAIINDFCVVTSA
jgi:NO-binding membrane sensor protein with MHYT domain